MASRRVWKSPFILFVMVGLFAAVGSAQVFTGAISGVVKDRSGAVVPGAKLILTNTATSGEKQQTTKSAGTFAFPQLTPGNYRLEVEKQGFKRFVRSGLTIQVNQNIVISPVLEVGSVTQTVEVTAQTPLLQPATSSLGQVVGSQNIENLPLVGRNTLALVELTPGTQPLGAFGGVPAQTNAYNQGFFSVGGSQVLTNSTLIDGIPADQALFNAPAFVPSPDDVQEFKVQTADLPAEFGRTGGAVVNIVTKSGTNQLHGTIYEYFRNSVLNANNFFTNRAGKPIPFSNMNQFGVAGGGPVVLPHIYNGRNKTFWFFNYEGLRDREGQTLLTTVPTPTQLNGDFSQTFNSSGSLVTIYDPLTTRPDPANPGQYIRDAFLGNIIPPDRIDPVSAKVRTYWPSPNTAGTASGANNFFGTGTAPNTENMYTVRVDESISSSQELYFRFSSSNNDRGAVDYFHNGTGWVNPGGGGVPLLFGAKNADLGYTWTVNPTTVVNLTTGYVREVIFKDPALTGIDLTTLGYPAQFAHGFYWDAFPSIQPSGYKALAASTSDLIHRYDSTFQWAGTLTKVFSRHTVKTGAELLYIPLNELQPGAPQGVFNFSTGFTGANPLASSSTSGSSIASFLLGYPSSGSTDFNPALSVSSNYLGAYVQDDYRATNKLTLNLGIRFEMETARNERYNRLSWFNPAIANPAGSQVGIPNLKGGLQFPGVNGNGRRQENLTKGFAPRVGLAYRLTPKTVIRTGYGLFYLPRTGDGVGSTLGAAGFFATTPFVSSTDGGLTPANQLSNPFPNGLINPPGSSLGAQTLLGESLGAVLPRQNYSYAQNWNFDVQRELPGNILFDIAYQGSEGTFLPISAQLDQLPDKDLALGSALLSQVTNPFASLVTTGPLSLPTVTAGQLLLPFPEFTGVTTYGTHEGSSNYHSLQLKVERRFSHGLSFLGAYTFSKALGDVPAALSIGFANPGYQDNNNLHGEYALQEYDMPQRLVLAYTWELPMGPGHNFLGGVRGPLSKLIAGWQVNGINTFQSGVPLGLTTANNLTHSYGGGSRPNMLCNPALHSSTESRLNKWFNTSCFAQPAAFTFGNASRTLPNVRGPGFVDFDLSFFKNTHLTEKTNLQIRAELFNAFNNVNFGSPGTTFGTSSFGVIGSAGAARIIQLAAKIQF